MTRGLVLKPKSVKGVIRGARDQMELKPAAWDRSADDESDGVLPDDPWPRLWLKPEVVLIEPSSNSALSSNNTAAWCSLWMAKDGQGGDVISAGVMNGEGWGVSICFFIFYFIGTPVTTGIYERRMHPQLLSWRIQDLPATYNWFDFNVES